MGGIFKAYDIRGIYPTELNEETAAKIGKAIGTLRNGSIAVGCDVRKSSPAIKAALMKGLLYAGVHLTDVGQITTPMMIFATAKYGFNSGLIVTASHNPPDYNGIKLFNVGGAPISYEAGIKEIEDTVNTQRFYSGEGRAETKEIYQDYKKFLLSSLKISGKIKMKIVVDCFNGADSKAAPDVLRALGVDVIELRCNFDGDFPATGPDPSQEGNLDLLRKRVVEENADLGFAYDGDGDRLAVVDKNGDSVDTKIIFSLLTESIERGSKVVYDILTSDTVVNTIKKNENIPIVCRVGHTYITEKILQEKAALGGELSGHFYFKETFGGDDALFASLKVLEALITKQISLDSYTLNYPPSFSGNARVLVNPEKKTEFVNGLKQSLSSSYKVDTLDGVKIFLEGGWAVFRASNTEPKISIAYESPTHEGFQRIKAFVEDIISTIPK